MKKEALCVGSVVFVFTLGCGAEVRKPIDNSWIEYPGARRGDQMDVYHGVEVPDPYRWMEDEAEVVPTSCSSITGGCRMKPDSSTPTSTFRR